MSGTYHFAKVIRPNLALFHLGLTITPRVAEDNQSVIEFLRGLELASQRDGIAKFPPRQEPSCIQNSADSDGAKAVESIEHAHGEDPLKPDTESREKKVGI